MKLGVRQSTIMAFLLYHAIFIKLEYLQGYGVFKYLGLIIVTIFLLLRIKLFTKKKYLKINIVLIIFCMIIIISAVSNVKVYANRSFLIGVFHAISILNVYLFFEYMSFIKKVKNCINIFYRLTLFYVIINDIILIFIPNIFIKFQNYFVGNKFEVSYLHILLLILFYQLNINKINKSIIIKMKLILIFILSTYICIKVECTTAFIGCLIILIFIIFKKLLKTIITSNKIMLIALGVSDSILLISSSILSIPIINYFIVNILNEDITLTGRMRIYKEVGSIIKEKLALGYGYGNSYFILIEKIYAPNTQNGILECIINYGIIGTLLMIILMYLSMKNNKRNININMYPIITLIYVYIFLSSVEITLGISILSLFAIINAESEEEWLL